MSNEPSLMKIDYTRTKTSFKKASVIVLLCIDPDRPTIDPLNIE